MVRKGEDHIALAEAVCVGLRETILPSEKMFILGPQFIFFNSAHITKSSSEKGRKRERESERERERERKRKIESKRRGKSSISRQIYTHIN